MNRDGNHTAVNGSQEERVLTPRAIPNSSNGLRKHYLEDPFSAVNLPNPQQLKLPYCGFSAPTCLWGLWMLGLLSMGEGRRGRERRGGAHRIT